MVAREARVLGPLPQASSAEDEEALVREALHRDEEGEQLPVLETNWEWEHAEPGGPLEDRGQWATLSTPAIFEPTWNDGLGAPA